VARLLVYSIGLIVSVIAMLASNPDSGFFAVSSGFAIGFAIPLLDALLGHSRLLKIAWYSLRTRRSRVRISASYLYRIRADDKYLLVKGVRFDQYQPVGGVYKAHPSSSGERKGMSVLDDNLLVPDAVSEGDLRVRVPGKNLLSFVRWFESGRGRETDGWREFHEELIATGILDKDVFRLIKYDRIQRLYRPMRYSPWAESQELLIADVLELIPTPAQLNELRGLKNGSDSRILWATESQIRRLGAADDVASQTTRIAETAVWTIDASI
jgi:SMODS-associated NUDIX domain